MHKQWRQTAKTKTTTKKLNRQTPVRNRQAMLIAAAFAIVGSVLLYRSFAVTSSLAGDLNGDKVVNLVDLSILLSHYGQTSGIGDLNSDNQVNLSDISILLSNFGKTDTSPGPSPAPPPGGPACDSNPGAPG